MATDARTPANDRVFFVLNAVVSAAALALIGYLLLGRRADD